MINERRVSLKYNSRAMGSSDCAPRSTIVLAVQNNAVLKHKRSGRGWKRGFRVKDSSVYTYVQERAALTYFYGKHKVLDVGVSTAPMDV